MSRGKRNDKRHALRAAVTIAMAVVSRPAAKPWKEYHGLRWRSYADKTVCFVVPPRAAVREEECEVVVG